MATSDLRSITHVTKDGEWGKAEPFDSSVEMAVIRGTDFSNARVGVLDDIPTRHIPEHIAARKRLQPFDILIETAGGTKDQPTGRTLFIKPSLVAKSVLPLTCASFARFIRINRSKADPEYIFWLLQSLYQGGAIRQYHTQHTGVARFQFTTFAEREALALPDMATQKRIASVLSAYDDLIENNTRRIKILEEMAQMIYREWFVHFRFPGHEKVRMVESELGLIPEGWCIRPIGDIAKVKGGKRLPSGKMVIDQITAHPYLRVKDMLPSGVDPSEIKYITEDVHRLISRYIITDADIYISIAGTIGRVGIVPKFLSGANLTENAAKITDIAGTSRFLLLAQLRDSAGQAKIASKVAGTSQPKLALYKIEEIKLLVPTSSMQARADELLGEFHRQIEILHRISTNLRTSRDLLLPKLISGEISVGRADSRPAEFLSNESEEIALLA